MPHKINKSGDDLTGLLAKHPTFYTIDEVSAFLKCTRRHLQRLISKGSIRVIKLGAASRIEAQSLAEDLERLTAQVKQG